MSVIEELLCSADNKWQKSNPADLKDIEQLRLRSQFKIPDDYFSFLSQTNGGVGFLDIQPGILRLWPAEDVLKRQADYEMEDYVPNFFAFGDNSGQEFFAFDKREVPISKIYSIPFICMDEDQAEFVADDFLQLLAHVVPREAALSE